MAMTCDAIPLLYRWATPWHPTDYVVWARFQSPNRRWVDGQCWSVSMFLYDEEVDVVSVAANNNLIDLVPDTSFGITCYVGQGLNAVCGDIESLNDVWCSSAGGWIRDMASDWFALTMLCHSQIALWTSVFKAFQVGPQFFKDYFHFVFIVV